MNSAKFKCNFELNDKGKYPYQQQPYMLRVQYDPYSIPSQFAKLQKQEKTIAINYLHANPEIKTSLINRLMYLLQEGVGLRDSSLPTIAERIKKTIDETLGNLSAFLLRFVTENKNVEKDLRKFLGLDENTQVITQS